MWIVHLTAPTFCSSWGSSDVCGWMGRNSPPLCATLIDTSVVFALTISGELHCLQAPASPLGTIMVHDCTNYIAVLAHRICSTLDIAMERKIRSPPLLPQVLLSLSRSSWHVVVANWGLLNLCIYLLVRQAGNQPTHTHVPFIGCYLLLLLYEMTWRLCCCSTSSRF